jgi:hypothetical protein
MSFLKTCIDRCYGQRWPLNLQQTEYSELRPHYEHQKRISNCALITRIAFFTAGVTGLAFTISHFVNDYSPENPSLKDLGYAVGLIASGCSSLGSILPINYCYCGSNVINTDLNNGH